MVVICTLSKPNIYWSSVGLPQLMIGLLYETDSHHYSQRITNIYLYHENYMNTLSWVGLKKFRQSHIKLLMAWCVIWFLDCVIQNHIFGSCILVSSTASKVFSCSCTCFVYSKKTEIQRIGSEDTQISH